jgi:hypothetical protein
LDDVCLLARPFLAAGGLFVAQVGEAWSRSGDADRLVALGFSLAQERGLPPSWGGAGRRVLALRKGEA